MAGAHPNGPPPPYEALPPRVLNMPAPYERRYPSANNNLNWNSWNNNRRPGRPNTTCRNRNPRNRELYIPCDCSFCVERNRSIHVRVVTDSSNTHADQSSRIARALEDRFGPVETVVSGKVPLVFIVR
jgi:hypothetical protein